MVMVTIYLNSLILTQLPDNYETDPNFAEKGAAEKIEDVSRVVSEITRIPTIGGWVGESLSASF